MKTKNPIFSDSFTNFLGKNKDKKVCRYLRYSTQERYNFIFSGDVNYITMRTNGMISYLPSDKPHIVNADGSWNRQGRQEMKPGKFIKKFFIPLAFKYITDSEIEKFSNIYRGNCDGGEFKIGKGQIIKDVYNMQHEGGTLGSSCMAGDSDYLDIYSENKCVSILYLIKGEILNGRAILWEINGETYMDRVYYKEDYIKEMFLNFAKENNFHHKYEQNYHNKTWWVSPNGEKFEKVLKINLVTDFDQYPYIDTFTYGGEGFLINDKGDNCYFQYKNTDGSREETGRVYDSLNDLYIDENSAVYIDRGRFRGDYIHMDDAIEINGVWWWEGDENIVRLHNGDYAESDEVCEVSGEYYLLEDCIYSDYDDCYYLIDDCEECPECGWVLRSECYLVAGTYYHESKVERA